MSKTFSKRKNKNDHLLNDEIKFKKVRLSGDGGIYDIEEIRNMAEEDDMDIMLLTDKSDPPVVQICDYNKYLYKQKKIKKDLENKQRKANKDLKQMRLTPNISDQDMDVKVRKIKEFIESGHNVKLDMRFKGRMIRNTDLGKEVILKIAIQLEDISKPNGLPKMSGRSMSMTLVPK